MRDVLVMAKPTGPQCNLDCAYCYYLEREALFEGGSRRMPEALLERYIEGRLSASPGPTTHFEWHGGEPTLLGRAYFETIVAFQEKHRPPGRTITNGLQTNGTRLGEDFVRFLAENGFTVGLSLDGPMDLHDPYRPNKGGRGTHREVMRALRLLARRQVHTDVLCVVHALNAPHPARVYDFFRDEGVRFLQLLPLVEPDPASPRGVTERTAPAEELGAFLCEVFDRWARRDVGRIVVQTFDEALRPVYGLDHALCIHRETCGDVVALEHDGSLYACDHFVDPAHRLGSLIETPLEVLVADPALIGFGRAKKDDLPAACRACEVLDFCHGGCPKDRIVRTADGEAGPRARPLNYLCPAYLRLFTHARPVLERLAAHLRAGRPLEGFSAALRAEAAPGPRAGRNDPCPCGSGRKYKKCCLPKDRGGG